MRTWMFRVIATDKRVVAQHSTGAPAIRLSFALCASMT